MSVSKQQTTFQDGALYVTRSDSVTEHVNSPEGQRRTLYSYFAIGTLPTTMNRGDVERLIRLLREALDATQTQMPHDLKSGV